MKESYWGYVLILIGMIAFVIMMIVRDYQTTNDNDYYIMKEVLQDAMIDSVDYAYWRENNELRIMEEKFVENYLRRFAHSMSSNKNYKIEIFDIVEEPPKASVKVSTSTGNYMVNMQSQDVVNFGVVTLMSGILDTKNPENLGIEYYNNSTPLYNVTVYVTNGSISGSDSTQIVSSGSNVTVTTLPNSSNLSYDSFKCSGEATKYVNDGVLNLRNIKSDVVCTIVYSAKCKKSANEVVLNQGYTGKEESFYAPCDGYYKIEAWGAQGGGANINSAYGSKAGLGGYSVGVVKLSENGHLFLYVGGKGIYGSGTNRYGGPKGGFNGGGDGGNNTSGSGGGATHVSAWPGLLSALSTHQSSVLIVAGGGGGADNSTTELPGNTDDGSGGSGGGYKGGNALINGSASSDTGATQTSGAAFGQGANVSYNTDTGGGGGGWYGGKITNNSNGGGGGGSGYIASNSLTSTTDITKHMYAYSTTYANRRAASYRTTFGTCSNINPTSDCAKLGNGHIMITYLGNDETITLVEDAGDSCPEYEEDEEILKEGYTGSEKSITLACDGIYKLEAWGAQGVDSSVNYVGGNGGYTVGKINAASGTKLYINVGGKGTNYNGGHATSGCCHLGSGGASSIATSSGQISALSSNKGNILIVAGGGGGARSGGNGGAGGGGNSTGVRGTDGGYGGGGTGGTFSAGGSASWGRTMGIAGTFGNGGTNTGGDRSGGSMGGGGYYGGGPGGSDYSRYNDNDDGAGGGGSGYANTSKIFDIEGKNGEKTGNGKVVITYLGE